MVCPRKGNSGERQSGTDKKEAHETNKQGREQEKRDKRAEQRLYFFISLHVM